MLKINESITAYDAAEALAGDSGVFELKRGGQTFRLVSRAGHSITSLRPILADTQAQGGNPEPWRIKKVGELRSEQEQVV